MKVAAASRLQKNAEPLSPVKEKVAAVWLVRLDGLPVIDGTAGGIVSTVQERETAAEVFPAASFASTWKVCAPWPRLE